MILQILSAVYGAAATWRRRWHASDGSRRRRLGRPVISVGNLRVGGSGKTPLVAYLARLLRDQGHRPAVLTRGYGRRDAADGVTVVSDGESILVDLARAGDEPLMLARAVAGTPVLVGANRYLSGLLAERRFGATVHVLDDAFQHLELERDVDLLLVDESDLSDAVLPAGRLREPLANAVVADAAMVTAGYTTAAERIGRALGVQTAFRMTRALGAPYFIDSGDSVVVPAAARVFAVTSVARPERFVADLSAVGWQVVDTLTFRDHHAYHARDVARIVAAATAASAAIVLTTEKDAAGLAACRLDGLPIAAVPLAFGVEPADAFRDWLLERLRAAEQTLSARLKPSRYHDRERRAPGPPPAARRAPDENA